MGVYTDWTDGYLLESAYGTSLIANTNTQTYSLGVFSEDAIHPTPECDIIYEGAGTTKQVADAGAWKGPERLRGAYVIVLQNGILCYLALGSSSTAASVHTITPTTTSLPSVTVQHDLTGTATDWGTQYKGVQVARLELNCAYDTQYLWANVDWVAQSAAKQAFISTNTPTLPATANSAPYKFSQLTATFAGNSFRTNLKSVSFSMTPNFIHWTDGTRTPPQPIEGDRFSYQLKFEHTPADTTFFDELVATGNTSDVVLKWTRSANDYIEITMTNCHINHAPQKSPKKGRSLIEEVWGEPEQVSIAIKDSVGVSHYGE
jgi:hypothetical protein